jgi:hypothetical protein
MTGDHGGQTAVAGVRTGNVPPTNGDGRGMGWDPEVWGALCVRGKPEEHHVFCGIPDGSTADEILPKTGELPRARYGVCGTPYRPQKGADLGVPR